MLGTLFLVLVHYRRQRMADAELLQSYLDLNGSDLAAAWDYFAAHAQVGIDDVE